MFHHEKYVYLCNLVPPSPVRKRTLVSQPSFHRYVLFECLLGEHTNELGLIIMLSGNRYLFFIIKSKKFHNNNFLLALGAIDKKLSSRFADFGLPQTLQGQNQILQIFVSLVLFVSCFICFLTAVYAFLTYVFYEKP